MAEKDQEVEKLEHGMGPRQSGTIATTETSSKSGHAPSASLERDVNAESKQPCRIARGEDASNTEAAVVAEGGSAAQSTQANIHERENALPEGSTPEDGNDQVTTDEPPNRPLQLIDTTLDSKLLEKTEESVELSKRKEVVQKLSVSALRDDAEGVSSCKSSKADEQSCAPNQIPRQGPPKTTHPEAPVDGNINRENPEPDDPTDFNEDTIATSDSRLGENIAQFVRPSDQTIDEARQRLKTALKQTYALRKAFTERVYGKYRVCLHPPNTPSEAEAKIKEDPASAYERLCRDMSKYHDEKEIEKKFANKITSDVAAVQQAHQGSSSIDASPGIVAAARMFAQGNVDHGDQLLYVSAGLNLIILPEEDVPASSLKMYSERCPLHPVTGQRVKNISLAAATAGDVMLERKRKAMILRMERQQQNPSQYPDAPPFTLKNISCSDNATETTSAVADSSSAKMPIFSSVKVVNKALPIQPAKARTSEVATTSKASRSRVSSGLSFGQLLSLNPTAEEFARPPQEIKTFAPSTLALMARGSRFGVNKSAQQRLRHPHPDSLGGRRRASVDAPPGSVDPTQSEPFSNEYLALTLPPLPGTNERQERKPLPVCTTNGASTPRGISSIQKILDNFVVGGDGEQTCDVTKIKLLYGLPRLVNKQKSESAVSAATVASKAADGIGQAPNNDPRPLDPILTFSVLHAVGLLGRAPVTASSKVGNLLPPIDEKNSALWSSKLMSLHGSIVNADRSLTSVIFAVDRKRQRENEGQSSEKKPKREYNAAAPVQSIRGGGGTSKDKKAENVNNARRKSQLKTKRSSSRKMSEDSATSVKSAPVMSTSHMSNVATPAPSVHLFNMQMMNQMGNYTQFQMANAFHQLHHSAAGDLANLHNFQRQHAVAQFMGAVSNPMHAFSPFGGIVPGYGPIGTHGLLTKDQANTFAGKKVASKVPAPNGKDKSQAPIELQQVHESEKAAPPEKTGAVNDVHSKQSRNAKEDTDTKEIAVESNAVPLNAREKKGIKTIESPQNTGKQEMGLLISKEGHGAGKNDAFIASISKERTESSRHIENIKPESKDTEGKNPFAEQWKSEDQQARKNDEHRLKYYTPSAPDLIGEEDAALIRTGYVHTVLEKTKDMPRLNACLEHLHQVGAAVPIPKSLVVLPLRDRMSNLTLKLPGNVAPPTLSREAVTAVILVWLWANHESNFQTAFEKSGRIDVDPDCKWLIQTAVDTAVRELSTDIADSLSKGEGVYADLTTSKKNVAAKTAQGQETADTERNKSLVSKKIEIRTVLVVSKALMVKLHIEPFANKCIPNFEPAIAFLDESRVGALRAKAQERVMLANFLARTTSVSESFSHAYVSAMVRAGEALGHGQLFEAVQNESLRVSTMIPYDIFTDESGAWEDPCKIDTGFTPGTSGEELTRRAHARAMFHKSLRKLQDRHNIRGGVKDHGPYADGTDAPGTSKISQVIGSSNARAGLKRRHSFSEPPPPPGTGSAPASSWAVYQPQHASEPLDWDSHQLENKPYGRYRQGGGDDRRRSLSFSGARAGSSKKVRKSDGMIDLTCSDSSPKVEEAHGEEDVPKSTFEIKWGDLAGIFQRVELPRSRRSSSSRNLRKSDRHDDGKSTRSGTIFAPFCRPITDLRDLERQLADASSEDDDAEEEDISDETVLAHHQLVLDEMKAKIQAYMDEKKNQKEQKKMRMSISK